MAGRQYTWSRCRVRFVGAGRRVQSRLAQQPPDDSRPYELGFTVLLYYFVGCRLLAEFWSMGGSRPRTPNPPQGTFWQHKALRLCTNFKV